MSLWILTRGLGLSDSIQADVHSHELRAGDVIILATDGLTSLLTAGEMLDVLDEHQDIGAAVSTLIDLSNARGGHDNITVLIGRWAP
jgi:protein phosphatase